MAEAGHRSRTLSRLALGLGGLGRVWWAAGAFHRWAAWRAQQRLAQRRADALLRDLLTPAEYTQVVREHQLVVPSPMRPGRVYTIPVNGRPVVVREPDGSVVYLCLRPAERLPGAEGVLVHKLCLEAAEDEYWRRANTIGSWSPRQEPIPLWGWMDWWMM